jgi:2',3'-cyclic-nucleotide 2'-phosphodiesterase (5'-nucleotidase family)
MGYKSYLQMMAKALKTGTGAEAALVKGAARYARWRKGFYDTVTVDKVATIDSFPDYVVVCEIRGAHLRELSRRWCTSTVLKSADHPAYEPGVTLTFDDIIPRKFYRVAMNYWVTDTSFVSFTDKRMNFPPLLRLRTPNDYAKNPFIDLRCRNMMLTEYQTQRLVIDYLRGKEGGEK